MNTRDDKENTYTNIYSHVRVWVYVFIGYSVLALINHVGIIVVALSLFEELKTNDFSKFPAIKYFFDNAIYFALVLTVLDLLGLIGALGFLNKKELWRKTLRFVSFTYLVIVMVGMILFFKPSLWFKVPEIMLKIEPHSFIEVLHRFFICIVVSLFYVPIGYLFYLLGDENIKKQME